MSYILINIEPIVQEEKLKVTNIVQELKLLANEPYYNRQFKAQFDEPYGYMGFAPKGTADDVSLWRIYRIEYFNDGSTDIKIEYNVKWSDLLTIDFSG